MLAVAGLAICEQCVVLASDFYAKREIAASAPRRPGWTRGWPDPEALAAAEASALEAEVGLLDEIVAPIERFRRGAEAALGGAAREEIATALGHHTHRSPIALPDGTTVIAVSYLDADPYGRDHPPDFGLYLDTRWAPPWEYEHLDWPDFGVPADRPGTIAALRSLLDRARRGKRVEIGCLGGHGRTGTALACLTVLTGHPPGDAVRWVRTTYCTDAVETAAQAAFVTDLLA